MPLFFQQTGAPTPTVALVGANLRSSDAVIVVAHAGGVVLLLQAAAISTTMEIEVTTAAGRADVAMCMTPMCCKPVKQH